MGIYGDEPRGHKPAIIPTQKDLQNMKAKEEEEKAKKQEANRRLMDSLR
ncbi:hypothetical protein HXK64_01955 [Candidatus Gracilibacteria bacterium]|nr:hypothetical protein [Candidatus Gracilibacteria bacterium]